MDFYLWSILITFIVGYLPLGIAKNHKDFDNGAPRPFLDTLKGRGQRAYWAHQNSHEIFPLYAAAILVAHMGSTNADTLNYIAGAFILSRVLYIAAYVKDKPTFRSIVWAFGLGCIIGLFALAA